MARYGDLDKLAVKWRLASPTQRQNFGEIIESHPTADVVPKSEVERLNAVMKEMDEQRAYTINMLGESLEKAKAEVEELSGKYEDLKLKYADLQKDKDELIAWGGHIKSSEKTEVAREIFEEIESIIRKHNERPKYQLILDLAELKKKYTEG